MHVSVIKYANCKINTRAKRYEKQFGPNEIYGVLSWARNKRGMCKVHLSSRKDCFLRSPICSPPNFFPLAVILCESLATLSLPCHHPQIFFFPGSLNGVFIQIIFEVHCRERAAKAKEAVNCLNWCSLSCYGPSLCQLSWQDLFIFI